MSEDKELLELAAKAAGIPLAKWGPKGTWDEDPQLEGWMDTTCNFWNPLTDDGDALRLAVKLGLRISVETWSDGSDVVLVEDETEFCDNDPYAATRRAIVRAAAEIGKAMQ